MKKGIITAYIALALTIFVPKLPGFEPLPAAQPTAPAVPGSALVAPIPTVEGSPPAPEESPAAAEAFAPVPDTLSLLTPDGIIELETEEYIFGVLAAEMPASFEPEALKAQAVAARSYALYCISGAKHKDAALCSNSACCQAWQSNDALMDKWGADCTDNSAKLRAAVSATAGEYLSYDGRAVFAAFHSSSAGATESSGAIWNALPYLVSVESPETAADVPNFITRLECSALDFRDTILHDHPAADFTAPESEWIGFVQTDESGRVACALIGGAELSGSELRRLFSLRSTAFDLVYDGGCFVFTVRGYGHGVGMSQYGAEVMAKNGADYREILAHYYPSAVLVGH